MKAVTTTFVLIAGMAMAGVALAQSGQQSSPTTPSAGQTAPPPQARTEPAGAERQEARLDGDDASFLKQAAQNGQAELEASKLAQTKATQADVKSFAGKMIDDHQQAHQELAKLAADKGVKLPDDPSLLQRAKLKMLSAADGEKFDKRYADGFGVKAHEDTVKLFEEAAAKAKDADVKAFAQKTLPKLQEHLTLARAMEASVAPAAAGKSADRTARSGAAPERTERSDAAAGDKPEKKY